MLIKKNEFTLKSNIINKINLALTLKEVNSILNALGIQPYAQIHQLAGKIQTQGSAQLQAAKNGQHQVGEETEKAIRH